ncbi:MAG: 2-oxo acid dehydrogenase subunit E2 [Acidobacteriota bacterium]|nr:2-oxo acid dehydrogenase subunit E2 [Acidobacteriota bacterium]
MGDFTMPSLGADMEVGTITRWLVHPGDRVRRGDIVAVVQTDKSDIEVEIFEDGTVADLVIPEGVRVSVGTVLAHVTGDAEALGGATSIPTPAASRGVAPGVLLGPSAGATGAARIDATTTATAPPISVASAPIETPVASRAPTREPPVESPLVRHRAHQLGVDLAGVSGSGPGGVVTRADVEAARVSRAVPTPPPSSPYARRLAAELGVDLARLIGSGPRGAVRERDVRTGVPSTTGTTAPTAPTSVTSATSAASPDRQRAMQRAIGALMARSKREVPHYYLDTTIDLSAASRWLEETNRERPVADRLVMATLLFCATARAVARVPEMNGYFVDGEFSPRDSVNLGVAISQRHGGLIAPAIHAAQDLSPEEMMRRVRDLVRRARNGVLRGSELSESTLTVTNLGDLGVERVFGVIYPPQVALVGFGRVHERPTATQGLLGVQPCVIATLSGDHRVSDGMRGAHFLNEIERLLREPERL